MIEKSSGLDISRVLFGRGARLLPALAGAGGTARAAGPTCALALLCQGWQRLLHWGLCSIMFLLSCFLVPSLLSRLLEWLGRLLTGALQGQRGQALLPWHLPNRRSLAEPPLGISPGSPGMLLHPEPWQHLKPNLPPRRRVPTLLIRSAAPGDLAVDALGRWGGTGELFEVSPT